MGLRYNSTISIKEKLCACGCGRKGQIFSKGLLKDCWSRLKGKPIKKISDKRAVEVVNDDIEQSRSNITSDLDTIFSRYTRIAASNSKGYLNCFICGLELHYTNAHNMHYIQRSEMGSRFLEANNHAGCPQCNDIHETNTKPYTEKLDQWKNGTSEWLIEQSRQVAKISTEELRQLLSEYKFKLKLVKSKLNK